MSDYLKAEYGNRKGSDFPEALMRFIRLHIWKPKSVLDVGSGTGDFLAPWIDDTTVGLALDTSPDALRPEMKRRFIKYDFGYPVSSLHGLGELVFSKSVIEHQVDTVDFVRKLKLMTKIKGYVVIMAPDWETTWRTFYDDPTHVQPITEAGLKLAVEMAGLRLVYSGTLYQTARLLENRRWFDKLYALAVPQGIALWLEKKTGNPYFRWAKQKAVIVIAMRVSE